jgi:putative alpha-1,2-mannosidase
LAGDGITGWRKNVKAYTLIKDGARLAVVLVLAACGGSSTTDTAPPVEPPPPPEGRVDIPLTQYVNVLIGTETSLVGAYSGNNNPGAQTPFGMVSLSPNNVSGSIYGRGVNGYAYNEKTIQSFSMTHLNGPGCRGQGALTLMPRIAVNQQVPQFKHADETAKPGFYKVSTNDKVTTELTATTRTGMMRLTFPKNTGAFLLIDANKANDSQDNQAQWGNKTPGQVSLDTDKKTFSGMASVDVFCSGRWGQPMYFYGAFDTPLDTSLSTVKDGVARLAFDFGTDVPRSVQIKIGISSVSAANAKLNLEVENPDTEFDFDKVQAAADTVWNKHLNTIQIDAAAPEAIDALSPARAEIVKRYLVQFYSAFYRTMGGPTVYSDVNGDYRSMNQQADLGFPPRKIPARTVENVKNYAFQYGGQTVAYRTHYSTFSMWDTYRSLTQLQALLFPDRVGDMMQSLVADAQQCGAFPHWVDGSEDTRPMEGDHAPNVIAGSYAFGARRFDLAMARKYMLQSAEVANNACNDQQMSAAEADTFKKFYVAHGYVPYSTLYHAGSLTLERAMTDQSISTFLAALPTSGTDQTMIATLRKRAGNWANIVEDKTLTMKGRKENGSFTAADSFHEGTEPQYFWMPSYDWSALIARIGGNAAALNRLHRLHRLMFLRPDSWNGPLDDPLGLIEPNPQSLNSGETGLSLYIGNEPSFPIPWAYNWTRQPVYAQRAIPLIMRKTFYNEPGGLPGNDDIGALSGWYVWATLGLFPTVPSAPGMAVSTPQFAGITLWLGDKKLRIESDQQALVDKVSYIKEMTVNGKPYVGGWLPLDTIANGGTLHFSLSTTPSTWGTQVTLPSGPDADYRQAFFQSP